MTKTAKEVVKPRAVFLYYFDTYESDNEGYYVKTVNHVNISVYAHNKTGALEKVWQAFEGEKPYRYSYTRKAELLKVEELEAELCEEANQ